MVYTENASSNDLLIRVDPVLEVREVVFPMEKVNLLFKESFPFTPGLEQVELEHLFQFGELEVYVECDYFE